MTKNDRKIFFGNLLFLKSAAEHFRGRFTKPEEENSSGGAIEAMDCLDRLANLVAQDFHRDLIFRLRLIGRVDELACGLIDRDDPLVLVEDIELHLTLASAAGFATGAFVFELGFFVLERF